MSPRCKVTAKYEGAIPELRRFFAGVFLIEIEIDDDGVVEDFMFPDGATLRFNAQDGVAGNTRSGQHLASTRLAVSGPRSQEVYVRTTSLRQWGVLFHPLGWSRLVGKPASDYANRLVDGMQDPAFARFRPLAETLFGAEPDADAELQRLIAFCRTLESYEEPAAPAIIATYEALHDPEVVNVDKLVLRAGITRRTLERLCQRTFGFPPKLLLRRQRFVRSLAQFIADPSLKWVGALDAGYHDQSQFVRDFREFMGMTPTEFRLREKPVIEPVMRARIRYDEELRQALAKGCALIS